MFTFLKHLWGTDNDEVSAEAWSPPPRIPEGVRLYAVGDIHGQFYLLRNLLAMILQDAHTAPEQTRRVVVYLGDYIDRGDASKAVIDLLLQDPLPGFESVYLKGNHEDAMENFLANPTPNHGWTVHGGMSTLLSYGVRIAAGGTSAENHATLLRDKLVEAIPPEHKTFFTGLRTRFEMGDYFFVHAGVRPGVALDQQNPDDFLWIREPFLSNRQKYDQFIVHGHTISDAPTRFNNRIGIDTGAYYSGKLTCLVLAGEEQRILSTGG